MIRNKSNKITKSKGKHKIKTSKIKISKIKMSKIKSRFKKNKTKKLRKQKTKNKGGGPSDDVLDSVFNKFSNTNADNRDVIDMINEQKIILEKKLLEDIKLLDIDRSDLTCNQHNVKVSTAERIITKNPTQREEEEYAWNISKNNRIKSNIAQFFPEITELENRKKEIKNKNKYDERQILNDFLKKPETKKIINEIEKNEAKRIKSLLEMRVLTIDFESDDIDDEEYYKIYDEINNLGRINTSFVKAITKLKLQLFDLMNKFNEENIGKDDDEKKEIEAINKELNRLYYRKKLS